jgi:hypothetical protein
MVQGRLGRLTKAEVLGMDWRLKKIRPEFKLRANIPSPLKWTKKLIAFLIWMRYKIPGFSGIGHRAWGIGKKIECTSLSRELLYPENTKKNGQSLSPAP